MDNEYRELIKEALLLLTERCPRLVSSCYWAGTSAIAIEELEHRLSYDIDLHTQEALLDVRPLLKELQRAFPKSFKLVSAPDSFGSGFRATLTLPSGKEVLLEVLSNFDTIEAHELTEAKIVSGIKRVGIRKYLRDKLQCVLERSEARDFLDINAVLGRYPELVGFARRNLMSMDCALLVERLLGWTDQSIAVDLERYPGASSALAQETRDLLLAWTKEQL